MKIMTKISTLLIMISFVFTNTKELYVYSGESVINLSPVTKNKRVDIINKTYSTDSDEPLKKRSHKRRRKIRRPRQGR